MALLDLQKLTVGLSRTWAGFLRDWGRSLRSGNYPETTRYNYLLAAAQLARYLGEHSPDPDPDADDGAADPCVVSRAHVEAFQAWMVQTRSASTALNKYKCLQQFFRWLPGDEQVIERNPMDRVRPPKVPTKPVPVLGEADTAKVLQACRGKGFVGLRDEALVRLYDTMGLAVTCSLTRASWGFFGVGAAGSVDHGGHCVQVCRAAGFVVHPRRWVVERSLT
jgi:integrase/recombinase XerC